MGCRTVLWDALSGCYWCRGGRGCGVIRLARGPPSSAPVQSGSGIKVARWAGALHLMPRQSLLVYAPVCPPTVCCAAGFSSWVLFGGSDYIWLAVFGLFFRRVSVNCVMATDSDAAAVARPGITFDVTLDVPWNAPEAVLHLHADGAVKLDLDTVPDVLGLTGRRPEATVVRVLQGRDARSVRAMIPDPLVMERGFHDVTIVDMGDSPEPSLSLDDFFQLRSQWPVTVLRSMVWLQQDLDNMRAAAKKRFRTSRPGNYVTCGKWIKCTDTW